MLQRMQAQVGELLRLGVGIDRDHATLVVKFVGCNQHLVLSPVRRLEPSELSEPLNFTATFSSDPLSATRLTSALGFVRLFKASDASRNQRRRRHTHLAIHESRACPETVSPITFRRDAVFSRYFFDSRQRAAGSQETTIRLASSPNRTNPAASPSEAKVNLRSDALGRSRIPPARPRFRLRCSHAPTRPAHRWIISMIAFCRAASFSSRVPAGSPRARPEFPWRIRRSRTRLRRRSISPGSDRRNSTMRAPGCLKCGS